MAYFTWRHLDFNNLIYPYVYPSLNLLNEKHPHFMKTKWGCFIFTRTEAYSKINFSVIEVEELEIVIKYVSFPNVVISISSLKKPLIT